MKDEHVCQSFRVFIEILLSRDAGLGMQIVYKYRLEIKNRLVCARLMSGSRLGTRKNKNHS